MFRIKIKLLVTLALFAVIAILPAGAWLGPNVECGPMPVASAIPYGTLGSGIFEQETWSAGTGAAATGDQFSNEVLSPAIGGDLFGGFGACGFGAPFGGAGGYAQNGLGANQGFQNSAMGTFSKTAAFGLGPMPGLAFGIPVPGPAGLYYC